MHRLQPAAALVVTVTLLAHPSAVRAGTEDAVARARDLLATEDARGAIGVLEGALPAEPPQRSAVLDLLRRAYETAIRQAESAGQPRDAELYRDNLEILKRKSGRDRKAQLASPVATAPTDAAGVRAGTVAAAPHPSERIPNASPVRPISLANDGAVVPNAGSAPPSEPHSPESNLVVADAAFVHKHYAEAGRIYAALDHDGKLPKTRRDHWAYCRSYDVVRRINAKPSTPDEWQSIDREIEKIRELSPNNWFAEYLRNRASERTPGRAVNPSNKVIIRGAAPEEPPPIQPVSNQGASATPAKTAQASQTRPSEKSAPPAAGQWQVLETENFRILHSDGALAAQVAKLAEDARAGQFRRWTGLPARAAWSPRCDIYLYPSAQAFSRMTGQPEESPGFSTMGMNAGRVVARRINVRADHANLQKAILPHEITHVVLADLFPTQQIPRWADEGIAVLAEPHSEQRLRAADLEKPLVSGQLFKLNDLMAMDYPDGRYWSLYYAQSVSLTRFLVDQGTPGQFIQFVQAAQRNGVEAELRRVYQIEGYADLQQRWLGYARGKSTELTAINGEPARSQRR